MDNQVLIAEINSILDSIDINANVRGHTTDASSIKASNGKVLSNWAKNIYNKLKNIANKYAYEANPMLQIPVEELENGAKVYDKLLEAAKQIESDIMHNITCNSCKNNCVSQSTMGTTHPEHIDSCGEAQLYK